MGLSDRDYMKTRYRRLRGLDEFPVKPKPVVQKSWAFKRSSFVIAGLVIALLALYNRDAVVNFGHEVQPMPPSGMGWASREFRQSKKSAALTIRTGDTAVLVRLFDKDRDYELMSVLVRKNDIRNIIVPAGSYVLRAAYGRNWYGQTHLFGRFMRYERSVGLLDAREGLYMVLDFRGGGGLPLMVSETLT